jgi:hypothetical protein
MNKRFVIFMALLVLVLALSACGSSAPAGVSNLVLSTTKGGTTNITTFAPGDTIYLSSDLNQVDKGTSFDIKWFALNVSGQNAATPFLTSNVVYDGTGNNTLNAQVNSTTGGFPVGDYNVEIDMNGVKAAEQAFNIQ